jgi:hypothetical protein
LTEFGCQRQRVFHEFGLFTVVKGRSHLFHVQLQLSWQVIDIVVKDVQLLGGPLELSVICQPLELRV